jgi:Zn-finger nucleic acid-binding protein
LQARGERWPCASCDGAFVENPALEQMMGEMRKAPWELPEAAGEAGARACPACAEAMVVQHLEGVEVDRCAAHGVWFDAGELAIALHGSAPPRGWLARLLGH